MRVIDFHNHYYPPEYLDALGPSGSRLTITHDNDGNPVVHYPGDYNVMVRGHRDIAYRQGVLDVHQVTTQVISLTTPGTHVEEPAVAIKLSQITNDAFARVRDERRGRFEPLATLPLNDPAASAKEFIRAVDELKFAGAMLFSNVNGTGLDDSLSPGRGSDARVLADAPERVPVRHHAGRVQAGVQRRREAVSAHPLGAGTPRRHDSLSCRAPRPRLACVQGLPRAH
jgi:predicted TIM-barrel fold metal-dependent hydrolase